MSPAPARDNFSLDPDAYYMALGNVPMSSPPPQPRSIQPAENLYNRNSAPSVEEFKEIRSLSDMLEVVH